MVVVNINIKVVVRRNFLILIMIICHCCNTTNFLWNSNCRIFIRSRLKSKNSFAPWPLYIYLLPPCTISSRYLLFCDRYSNFSRFSRFTWRCTVVHEPYLIWILWWCTSSSSSPTVELAAPPNQPLLCISVVWHATTQLLHIGLLRHNKIQLNFCSKIYLIEGVPLLESI